MSTTGFSAFLARKKIKPSAKLYFVDAMSAMAMGLFASLLIGTILDTLGDQLHWEWLITAAGYAGSATGIAIASGMGTCGLVGPIGIVSWEGFGGAFHWLGLILVCFVLPAILTPLITLPMRRFGWIKAGDCKLDL